jgi:DNA-binding IclR family transcriptional regulator
MAQRGIQSIEVGGRLLVALAGAGRALPLKELAQAAGMTAAKAHPYLVSYGKLGLIVQDGHGGPGGQAGPAGPSGRYGLGPLAMQLGLISLQQVDPLRLATQRLPALAAEIGQTVGITVWGEQGPTVVRTEEAPTPVHVTMRHGAVMSLRGTASGRLFAAYLPRKVVQAAGGRIDAAFAQELAAIRGAGLSHAVDSAVPGVSGLAAPVFDGSGALVLALTAIGASASFDTRAQGTAAQALTRCAGELTAQLGVV